MRGKEDHCIKWSNYKNHVSQLYFHLFETESMVDVTLCAEGQFIHAHRIVLSSCSSYFKTILSTSGESHPFIILSEMNFEDVKCIIEFVYRGEISLPADRFATMLKAAEDLQINGLMEVGHYLPDVNNEDDNEVTLEVWDAIEESSELSICQNISIYIDPNEEPFEPTVDTISTQEPAEVLVVSTDSSKSNKAKKRRRECSKKDYTEEALAAALEDLKSGRSILETSAAHRIPRSTLYVRARSQNIPIVPCRQDHPNEKVQAAVKAVSDGASLQQASQLFKIPKTVLWRRVQKEAGESGMKRGKTRDTCGFERKRAAIMALERGEKISKVSIQYQIPRTTLFREKTRLVESGKLPWTSQKKRLTDPDEYKELRLNEAVAACREGKMSQASASQRFQVPKTTIWRRLKDSKPLVNSSLVNEDGNVHSVENITSGETNVNSPGPLLTSVDGMSLNNNMKPVQENIVSDSESPENIIERCNENASHPDASHAHSSTVAQLDDQAVFSFEEVTSHIPVTYIDEANFTDSSLIILTSNDETSITLQENTQLIMEPNNNSRCVVVSECPENGDGNETHQNEFLEK